MVTKREDKLTAKTLPNKSGPIENVSAGKPWRERVLTDAVDAALVEQARAEAKLDGYRQWLKRTVTK